jgi:hypothetical protein
VAAYRLRPNAYGVQFHLETPADILQVWVSESPLLQESGADGGQILAEAYELEEVRRRQSQQLVELFLGWVRAYRVGKTGPEAPAGEGTGYISPEKAPA